jgi:glycosyltransferase involved in cell wall biosynthesis
LTLFPDDLPPVSAGDSIRGSGPLRILLVGTRVLPFRHGGDKNFWLDMIRGLIGQGHAVEVLSLMLDPLPPSDLPIRRIESIPVYLRPDLRFNPEYRYLAGTNNYASRTASLPRIVQEVRRRLKEFRPDVVHFADNYGPAMIGLRAACGPVPLTISAPTYQRTMSLYDLFLRASFSSFNVVVPFSDAYRQRLLEIGLPPERVQRIRWGIDVERFAPPSPAERAAARMKLGIDDGQFVVMWTGFIQQTNAKDLQFAVRTAEYALEHGPPGLVFLFCFKPEHYKETWKQFERSRLRVFGTADQFHAAVGSADLLLSPIQDTRSTAAPPLAWLECFAKGIPILTTDAPGTTEAVVPGVSGFAVPSQEEAQKRLLEIVEDPTLARRLRDGARQVAVERYSTARALQEYVDLWSRLARAPSRSPITKPVAVGLWKSAAGVPANGSPTFSRSADPPSRRRPPP